MSSSLLLSSPLLVSSHLLTSSTNVTKPTPPPLVWAPRPRLLPTEAVAASPTRLRLLLLRRHASRRRAPPPPPPPRRATRLRSTMAMTSRFLPFAALAAAGAGPLAAAAWTRYDPPDSLQGAATDAPRATGHLALVRAHPGLRDLNALLTPGAFLVDATSALLACGLRRVPYSPPQLHRDIDHYSAWMIAAKSGGDAAMAAECGLYLALNYARDGRLDDALATCALVAADNPRDSTPRIYAAALCYVLGRPEEAHRWLAESGPDSLSRAYDRFVFMDAVKSAALGCTPHSVEGSRELVMFATLGLAEVVLWSEFREGDLLERLQVLAFMAFLRRAVAKNLRDEDDAGEGSHEDAVSS